MNYIYDISINYNKELIDFYEWNKEDNIIFVLKIPVFKIDKKLFYDIYYNDITVEKNFLNHILNKTDIYSPNMIKKEKYSCVFTDGDNVICIKFSNIGKNVLKSTLSIEESEEVLEFSKLIKTTIINYKINRINKIKHNFYTRKQRNNLSISKKFINKIYINKKYNELRYIYYEIFNNYENNINIIISKINNYLLKEPKILMNIINNNCIKK